MVGGTGLNEKLRRMNCCKSDSMIQTKLNESCAQLHKMLTNVKHCHLFTIYING